MSFWTWLASGVLILFVLFLHQAYIDSGRKIGKAFADMYHTFVVKGDIFSTSVIFIFALLGPTLIPLIAYFFFRNWRDGLGYDENGNIDYPWRE